MLSYSLGTLKIPKASSEDLPRTYKSLYFEPNSRKFSVDRALSVYGITPDDPISDNLIEIANSTSLNIRMLVAANIWHLENGSPSEYKANDISESNPGFKRITKNYLSTNPANTKDTLVNLVAYTNYLHKKFYSYSVEIYEEEDDSDEDS